MCPSCAGTGQVAVTVRVGRKRRNAGQQEGICLGCFGSGTADPE
ncbi:DnaJ-class molecular chaperone [Streptacidiphilus sp. MAP12-33]